MTSPNIQEQELQKLLATRLAELPGPVQKAITSIDVPEKLRELSTKQKLHVDQWQTLENEVMLTILGFQPAEDLGKNIQNNVGISETDASAMTETIAATIFNPIREQLERELGHPQAKDEKLSEVDQLRADVLTTERIQGTGTVQPATAPTSIAPAAIPGTPPVAKSVEKAVRAPASGAYKPGETSAARADVHDDPYREPPA
jgi:hypothetical protein